MSFRNELNESINSIILKYNKAVAKEFNIDCEKLDKLWSNKTVVETESEIDTKPVEKIENKSESNGVSAAQLLKCNKPELKKLCKERGLKVTGTKAVLMQRLLGDKKAEDKPKKKEKKKVEKAPPVLKKLQSNISTMIIRRNAYGNLEHSESSLVFDRKTKKVIGKQGENGDIIPITKEDINICNKYKFDYILPENLDVNKGLDDVKVEELDGEIDDEEEIEDDEEEIIEEEEVLEEDDEDEEIIEEDEEVLEEEELASDEEFEYYEEEV